MELFHVEHDHADMLKIQMRGRQSMTDSTGVFWMTVKTRLPKF